MQNFEQYTKDLNDQEKKVFDNRSTISKQSRKDKESHKQRNYFRFKEDRF